MEREAGTGQYWVRKIISNNTRLRLRLRLRMEVTPITISSVREKFSDLNM
jgi:hypothetical protein